MEVPPLGAVMSRPPLPPRAAQVHHRVPRSDTTTMAMLEEKASRPSWSSIDRDSDLEAGPGAGAGSGDGRVRSEPESESPCDKSEIWCEAPSSQPPKTNGAAAVVVQDGDDEDGDDEDGDDDEDDESPPPQHQHPEGGLRGWCTVAGAFLCMTAVFGLNNSVGVLQPYWTSHQLRAFATRDVSWIPGFTNFLALSLGIYVGPLFDRFGPRPLLLPAGTVLFVAGLFSLAFLPTFPGDGVDVGIDNGNGTSNGDGTVSSAGMYAAIFCAWGVVMGAGAAVVGCVAIGSLAHWFNDRRATAMGVAFLGSSVGGVVFPQALNPLLESRGWRVTILVHAGVVAALLVAGNLLVRGRLPGRRREGGVVDLACFRDARFVWTSLAAALFQFALVAGVAMAPTWALARGFDSTTSTAVLSVMSAGSGVGRLVAGALADRIGRYNTMLLMVAVSILVVFALWLPVTEHTVPLYYVCGALFGYGTGSVLSVAPVCFGQLTTTDKFGLYYGTGQVLVSISAQVLNALGTNGLIVLFGCDLILSFLAFAMARWLIQGRRWQWLTWV